MKHKRKDSSLEPLPSLRDLIYDTPPKDDGKPSVPTFEPLPSLRELLYDEPLPADDTRTGKRE